MAYRFPRWSKTGVLFISLILGILTAHALFETPNVVGGGTAKMIVALVLMVLFKATIEFFLGKWQKRKDASRDDKPVV